jgi:glycerate 2-kinase
MNCVRRHLSAIKGGRLAAACHPAQVLTLLISDVPGDNGRSTSPPAPPWPTRALAPTRWPSSTATPSSCHAAVRALLQSAEGETLKPGDGRLAAPRPA